MSSLRDHAYYRTGGTCAALHAPSTVEELAAVMRELKRTGMPYFLLGGGTNSLVSDEPYPGAVVLFEKLTKLEVRDERLVVGAGVDNTHLAQRALAEGLNGAGWMNRLPGQLGGTVRMNARCYGGEISQIVTRVVTVLPDGTVEEHRDKGVFRGYKDTLFMLTGALVAEAEIELKRGDTADTARLMARCESDRVGKGQFDHPSCGCVFKNDYTVGVSSGLLLDAAGAKSMKHGGAEISPHHANFVFNKGATSRDILELSFAMQELVYKTFGAWMEYEMEVLGVLPPDLERRFREKRPHKLDESKLAPLRARMVGR